MIQINLSTSLALQTNKVNKMKEAIIKVDREVIIEKEETIMREVVTEMKIKKSMLTMMIQTILIREAQCQIDK
jgi:hypothetical protein